MNTCPGPYGFNSPLSSRRNFLRNAGGGFGMVALQSMLSQGGLLASPAPTGSVNPLAAQGSHYGGQAKNVIFLFMAGGPSHVDLFDYKPDLVRLAGKPIPDSFGEFKTRRKVAKNNLLGPLRPFHKHGQSGVEVSDWLPNIAECVDDICVLRGCYGDSVTHPESVYLMNTGSILMGRPSLGSWVTYGLGSENENMPAFVVMPDPKGWVKGGAPAWSNGYLPSTYQGTILRGGKTPILNLNNPVDVSNRQQRDTVELINRLNRNNLPVDSVGSPLAARISAYELAYRMQSHAHEVVDVAQESAATRKLYGLDNGVTSEFGTRCLLARRMVESGVRFVELYCGDKNGWDGHSEMDANHSQHCAQSDLPVAGLLKDLKSRGMLDSTLVIWGGEFGRMPMSEATDGRDHNPHGFSMWLAGGGVKGGQVIGATDQVGLRAEEEKVHAHDLHATILHLMGMDHTRLTYRHNGRDERLTDVFGNVVTKVFA
jgi:hypothetical protein